LIDLEEKGVPIIQQTRSFDASNDTTFAIRDKEDANDYRYFPDPDLAPFHLTDDYIKSIQESLPALPNSLQKSWKTSFGLSDYDVEQLSENKAEADFFASWTAQTQHYKAAANWMMGPIRAYLNESGKQYADLMQHIPQLNELLELVHTNQLSFNNASTKVFKGIIESTTSALEFATQNHFIQNNASDVIEAWVDQVINAHPDKVAAYKSGKKGLIGVFVGEVKKISKGQADPKVTTQILEQKLSQ